MKAVEEQRGTDRIVEILDEREPLATEAVRVIAEVFPPEDRQSTAELLSEIAEKRLGLLGFSAYHVLTAVDHDGSVMGTVTGVYLDGINAGFVTYLGVRSRYQGRQIARRMRTRLVEVFRDDALRAGWPELAWVIGEVRTESPWLRRLVRQRGAIAFDLTYYHPGMIPGASDAEFTLYRQPVGDQRAELPSTEVGRILYAIWRRAYRVRYPLQRDGFRLMLQDLEERETVGLDPRFPHPSA